MNRDRPRTLVRFARMLATVVGSCALAGAAMADEAAAQLRAAQRLLDAGQAEQAATLLERDLLRFAGNADYDYLLGLAWQQAGQDGPALFAFERVAMVDPGNIDARLKAARINLERGRAGYAENLLAPLSGLQPSPAQQHEAELLRVQIGALRAAPPIALRGYVLAGMAWDDNVTSGPDRSELTFGGTGPIPVAMGAAARDHDRTSFAEAGVSLRAALDDDTWLTGVGSLRQGDNVRRNDLKDGIANLDLGVMRRSGNDYFGALLLGQDYRLGGALYRSALGGRLNWIHPLSALARVTGYAQHIDYDYPDHPIDNAGRDIVGVLREAAAQHGRAAWQYGAYGGKEAASDPLHPHFSYRLLGMHAGYSRTVRDDLALSAGVVYELRRHLAVDGLYRDATRRDAQIALGVAADYSLDKRWHLVSRYTYTHNASNLELYQYARNTFALLLRWDFDHGYD